MVDVGLTNNWLLCRGILINLSLHTRGILILVVNTIKISVITDSLLIIYYLVCRCFYFSTYLGTWGYDSTLGMTRVPCKLVLVGSPHWMTNHVMASRNDNIIFLFIFY